MRQALAKTAWAVSLFASLTVQSSQAADLIWEVENPFRFFKPTTSFALHEAAFNAVRGDPSAPLPTDIVWRTERRLNDPDCKDASHPDKCAATAGKRYEQSRLGWAAQTVGETCYESNGRPRRYSAVCERKYSWGSAQGRLRAAGGAHGRDPDCARAARRRRRRLRLELAAAQGRRQGRDASKRRLQGQADDRARPLFARPRKLRRLGDGQAAGRPRAQRA